MVGKRFFAEIKGDIDARFALLDESLNIGNELSGVSGSKVDDDSTGSWHVVNNVGSSRLDNVKLVGCLIGIVGNFAPMVHTSSVCNFLWEVANSLEGAWELRVKNVIKSRSTDIDDLLMSRSPRLGVQRGHVVV